jgi:hypothetical protein
MTVLRLCNWSCNDCAPAPQLVLRSLCSSYGTGPAMTAPALQLVLQPLSACSRTGPAMTVLLILKWSRDGCALVLVLQWLAPVLGLVPVRYCEGCVPVLGNGNNPCDGCASGLGIVLRWVCSCSRTSPAQCDGCAPVLEFILQWLCVIG